MSLVGVVNDREGICLDEDLLNCELLINRRCLYTHKECSMLDMPQIGKENCGNYKEYLSFLKIAEMIANGER